MSEDITLNELYRQKPNVGVYVCHCGGNISDVVDVKKVVEEISRYHNVFVVRDYAFMCSAVGQSLIEEDIKRGVNRVVIAACMPALHEITFRNALVRAGLNPYLYEHVNIREQVSWVHRHDKDGATYKTISLIKAAIEKIVMQKPLDAIRINSTKAVCIIGGGIAGMTAALNIAENGIDVFLIEKEGKLGGKLNDIGNLFYNSENSLDILNLLVSKINENKKIKVYTNSEVYNVSGYIGNFKVEVKKSDGMFESINVGTIIIACGFEHYKPFEGEYGYGSKYVLRLPDFIKVLDNLEVKNGKFFYEGREIKNIAFIHCVGSRQIEGLDKPQSDGKVNQYCSRVCCTAGLFTINRLKKYFPDINIFDIFVDIRTYSMYGEKIYEEASRNDVLFIRRPYEERPQIEIKKDKITIKTKDVLTFNEEVEFDVDMVVLLTGIMPSDISHISNVIKLPKSTNRFLQEVHPKLRPVEIANDGIFVAGTSLGPMDIVETIQSSKTSCVKSIILLSKPDIPIDPYVAYVDDDKCIGCGLCTKECSYDGVLTMIEKEVGGKKKLVAQVNQALCKGCGACVAVCRPRAIDLAGWGLSQIEAMVKVIAKE